MPLFQETQSAPPQLSKEEMDSAKAEIVDREDREKAEKIRSSGGIIEAHLIPHRIKIASVELFQGHPRTAAEHLAIMLKSYEYAAATKKLPNENATDILAALHDGISRFGRQLALGLKENPNSYDRAETVEMMLRVPYPEPEKRQQVADLLFRVWTSIAIQQANAGDSSLTKLYVGKAETIIQNEGFDDKSKAVFAQIKKSIETVLKSRQ